MSDSIFTRSLENAIISLIDRAEAFGIPEQDIRNANEMLAATEYEVAWDTIVRQIYEYKIPIDEAFYAQVKIIAKALRITSKDYGFLRELIAKQK